MAQAEGQGGGRTQEAQGEASQEEGDQVKHDFIKFCFRIIIPSTSGSIYEFEARRILEKKWSFKLAESCFYIQGFSADEVTYNLNFIVTITVSFFDSKLQPIVITYVQIQSNN